jgi:predicted phosphodiesterase
MIRKSFGVTLAVFASLTLASSFAHAETFAWVQLGAGEEISARAIVEDGSCPTFAADGTRLAVSVRSDRSHIMDKVSPGTDLNQVTVCEAVVPNGTTSLTMTQERPGQGPATSILPLPPREIRRIVMFGDSGCRIKKTTTELDLQDCNNTDAWPYEKVVTQAAKAKPDLVIHVGDYHYRENQCPNPRDCGTIWGYGFAAWKADFFKPSQRLFEAAPWIMVRGNHEDCGRAGEGWFRFLDHAPMANECRDLTGFFVVKRSNLGFVVMDNAHAEEPTGDDAAKARLVALLHDQFRQVASDIPSEAWLLSHRPLNALRYDSRSGSVAENDIEQQAIGRDLPAGVRMVVSGHIHIFEALSFAGRRAPQLVIGTGGDNLEDIPPQRSRGVDVNHARVNRGLVFSRFGYMVWNKDGNAWNGTFYDDDGRALTQCTLKMRTLTCE